VHELHEVTIKWCIGRIGEDASLGGVDSVVSFVTLKVFSGRTRAKISWLGWEEQGIGVLGL
jgi:hypothetical protein